MSQPSSRVIDPFAALQELLAERNKQLVSMMAQAEKRGATGEGSPAGVLMRINLQERPVTERVQPGVHVCRAASLLHQSVEHCPFC